jgi:hypothetical protein
MRRCVAAVLTVSVEAGAPEQDQLLAVVSRRHDRKALRPALPVAWVVKAVLVVQVEALAVVGEAEARPSLLR